MACRAPATVCTSQQLQVPLQTALHIPQAQATTRGNHRKERGLEQGVRNGKECRWRLLEERFGANTVVGVGSCGKEQSGWPTEGGAFYADNADLGQDSVNLGKGMRQETGHKSRAFDRCHVAKQCRSQTSS